MFRLTLTRKLTIIKSFFHKQIKWHKKIDPQVQKKMEKYTFYLFILLNE